MMLMKLCCPWCTLTHAYIEWRTFELWPLDCGYDYDYGYGYDMLPLYSFNIHLLLNTILILHNKCYTNTIHNKYYTNTTQ